MTIYRKQRKGAAPRGRAVYGSAQVPPAQPVVPDPVAPEPAMSPTPEPPAVGAFATKPPAQAGLFSDDLFGGAFGADGRVDADYLFDAEAQAAATQEAVAADAPVYDVPAESLAAVDGGATGEVDQAAVAATELKTIELEDVMVEPVAEKHADLDTAEEKRDDSDAAAVPAAAGEATAVAEPVTAGTAAVQAESVVAEMVAAADAEPVTAAPVANGAPADKAAATPAETAAQATGSSAKEEPVRKTGAKRSSRPRKKTADATASAQDEVAAEKDAAPAHRTAKVHRTTGETDIQIELDLDGSGVAHISTGVPFFDHMLDAFTRHGLFDLTVTAVGDVEVDAHHTVEDTGIVLGQAFAQALGEKRGVTRFTDMTVPLDEALVQAVVDLSGRGQAYCKLPLPTERVGTFDTELAVEFFYAFARDARATLHVRELAGANSHHIIEAAFKAVGRAMRRACELDPRVTGVPSTKGSL